MQIDNSARGENFLNVTTLIRIHPAKNEEVDISDFPVSPSIPTSDKFSVWFLIFNIYKELLFSFFFNFGGFDFRNKKNLLIKELRKSKNQSC